MKTIYITFVSVLCFLFSAFNGCNAADGLKCNIGVADITPTDHVVLAGFAARKGLSTTVHRPLKTHCLVLSDGKQKICIITNDLMEVSKQSVDYIRRQISEQSGIPFDNILFHCIHTHSAPRTGGECSEPGGTNNNYRNTAFAAIISNAVATAANEAAFVPYTLEFGRGECLMNANRGEKGGFCDHTVSVLRFTGKDGRPIVSLVNYGCHPVCLNHRSLVVSSDYPGIVGEQMKPVWGGELFSFTGAAGNIDPAGGLSADTAYVLQKGTMLADVLKEIRFEKIKTGGRLKVANRQIGLPYATDCVTVEKVNAWADEAAGWTVSDTWKSDLERWRLRTVAKIERGEVKNYLPLDLTAVNVGGAVLLFTQGEPFSEYQADLRASLPEVTLLFIAYTNGQNSYLPSRHAYSTESYDYETRQMHVYIDAPYPLSSSAPEVYEKALRKIVESVK